MNIGSAAAAWQSSIEATILAGSAFAIFQSAAMGGYGVVVLVLGTALFAVALTASFRLLFKYHS